MGMSDDVTHLVGLFHQVVLEILEQSDLLVELVRVRDGRIHQVHFAVAS